MTMEHFVRRPGAVLKNFESVPLPGMDRLQQFSNSIYQQLDLENNLSDFPVETRNRIAFVMARQITRISQILGLSIPEEKLIRIATADQQKMVPLIGIGYLINYDEDQQRLIKRRQIIVNPGYLSKIASGWQNPLKRMINEAALETDLAHDLYHIRESTLFPNRKKTAVINFNIYMEREQFLKKWANSRDEKAAEIFACMTSKYRPKNTLLEKIVYSLNGIKTGYNLFLMKIY